MTITFIESTRETADIAAAPLVVIIMVSAVPMNELRICSIISGTRREKSLLPFTSPVISIGKRF